MAKDLFNNPANDYVYPALSPCAGAADNAYLEFTDKGIGIIEGSKILANIDFSDLQIPVTSYSTETKIIGEREVVYIPGLTKGLQKKQQGFFIPTLDSENYSLNPYFMQIDLSINYYKNFRYRLDAIDVSGNYGQNISIEDALNIALGNKKIKAEATYDPSLFTFTGTQDGYEFEITKAVLTLIPSADPSVFDEALTFVLDEDPSSFIPYAKYANGGMQGVIMKGVYPSDTPMCPYDKWLYINHVSNYVTVYEPIVIENFIADISANMDIVFDPSTVIGCGITEPVVVVDVSIYDDPSYLGPDVSLAAVSIPDISAGFLSTDSSLLVYGIVIDNSIVSDASLMNCIVTDSSIDISNVVDTSVSGSKIEDSYLYSGLVQNSTISGSGALITEFSDSSIILTSIEAGDVSTSKLDNVGLQDSNVWSSTLEDSSIRGSVLTDSSLISSSLIEDTIILNVDDLEDSKLYDSTVSGAQIENSELLEVSITNSTVDKSILEGDASLSFDLDSTVQVTESSLGYYVIDGALISNSYLRDSSIIGIDPSSSNNTIYISSVGDTSVFYTDIIESSLYSTWLYTTYVNRSILEGALAWDISINHSYISDSSIFGSWPDTSTSVVGEFSYFQDNSIYDSYLENSKVTESIIGQSNLTKSFFGETFFGECSIGDSSIVSGSIINNKSIINNCYIDQSWTNTYRLTIYTDPSTGVSQYLYVMNDPTLDIDISTNRVTINNSMIWDSSLNNADLNDCSIYRCYLEDVSLNGCTIYNTILDPSFYKALADNNRIIMVDPSIGNEIQITYDTSTFYTKKKKRLDVGMNGCSTDNVMSAGDYLEWITANDYWRKFGELYAWTSAADGCSGCHNLIDGFYVYNPHSFDVKIEYMLFV